MPQGRFGNPPRTGTPSDVLAQENVRKLRDPRVGYEAEAQIRPALQIFPPWLFLPERGGQDYTINETGILAAGAGATLVIPGTVHNVPAQYKAVLRLMTVFVNAPLVTIDVDWILRINEGPVPGWTFKTFPRAANSISIDFDGVVHVPDRAKIDVLVRNNNAAGPWTVGVQYSGWEWPAVLVRG